MELRNHTPFPGIAFESRNPQSKSFYVVVLRATLDLKDGKGPTLALRQDPLVLSDQYHGPSDHAGSLKQESDLAPFKPRCDVIVAATAFAPGAEPAQRFDVAVRVGRPSRPRPLPPRPYGLNPCLPAAPEALAAWERQKAWAKMNPAPGKRLLYKRLTVTGPRYWIKRGLGDWTLTRPAAVVSLPVRYEYAFGGQSRIESDDPDARRIKAHDQLSAARRKAHPDGLHNSPAAHSVCPHNPVGKGYVAPWMIRARRLTRIQAPQIESPEDPLGPLNKTCQPQGLGAIAKTWQPRLSLAGTHNAARYAQRYPDLPADFDYSYWNFAPPDMQTAWLEGNEEIELLNLTPDGRLCFHLPGHSPYALVRHANGSMAVAPLNLDTLIIDAPARRVNLVWRAGIPVRPAVRVIEARLKLNPAGGLKPAETMAGGMHG